MTHAYFHVDEDEECHMDPPAERLEQHAALGNSTSVLFVDCENNCMVVDALERAGWTSRETALKSNVSRDVMHNGDSRSLVVH